MGLRYYVATLAIAAGAILAAVPSAQADVTENISVPIDLSLTIPCNGHTVAVTGSDHILTSVTISNDGSHFYADAHFQRQGLSGTDLTTGAKYQGTGASQEQFSGNFVNSQEQISTHDSFQFIGQGSAPNLVFDQDGHLTFNANGDVTADFGNFSISCG